MATRHQTTLGDGSLMPRYLILEFEHDDEFGLFPDDLEIMLYRHSKPPFSVKVVGEGIRYYDADDMYTDPRFKLVPGESDG